MLPFLSLFTFFFIKNILYSFFAFIHDYMSLPHYTLNEMATFHFSLKTMNQTKTLNVATLALGLRSKQGVAKLRAKKEAQESCCMFPGVQESVRE